MNKLSILRIIFSILSLFLILTLSPFGIKNDDYNNKDLYRAVVLETLESDSTDTQKIKVLVEEGKFNGKEFNINNTLMLSDNLLTLKKNDKIVLLINEYEDGSLDITTYQYVREKKILHLVLFFILLVLIVGGFKGVHAVLSVAFTIAVISILLIPRLIRGDNPITVTIICSLIIAFFSLIIQQGFSKKTFSSLIGTLGGVSIAGIVTLIMSKSLQVSINSEDAIGLMQVTQGYNFNFQALLFSSIVIGALGANIDMSMSIATAMNELKESTPSISRNDLIRAGMNIGRDVIGTMSNTLVLAYVGSALVSLMIFVGYNVNLSYIINLEDISMEILRSLAGSIGIILCVPLTVFARAFMD
ncbi:YibE/F-like protein [Clostridium sp. N3C]|uniref:YibE/F family protein n=1 Tax=Clostridium sp. N3C TaxID=1776758 RepID=UPI00092E0FA4|nr:YibE/F family protein [Clostridium sp. N3C]SCN23541.1 YibE/F-like protein [Clostridium sp. N3C]